MTGMRDLPTFGLSHPKNYFGVPSAVAADGDTGGLIMGHLVKRQLGAARRGAVEIGLIEDDLTLTPLGTEVAAFATTEYGSHTAALEQFSEWKRRQTRFIRLNDGEWEVMAGEVMAAYEPAVRIAHVLDGAAHPLTLPEFVAEAGQTDPAVARMFVKSDVLDDLPPLDDIDPFDPLLDDRTHYRSKAVSHMKDILFHCGLLTESGSDSASLVPECDEWQLDYDTACVATVLDAEPSAEGVPLIEEGCV